MTYNDQFEALVCQLADAEVGRLVESMLNNAAVTSLEQYKYLLGQIEALRVTLPAFCEEANRQLAERR